VGQFQRLARWAEEDKARCESLRKVLRLTRGWETARDHALHAVINDNQLRIFSGDGAVGLLFNCEQGRIDNENPVGGRAPPRRCIQITQCSECLLQRDSASLLGQVGGSAIRLGPKPLHAYP
jgi:hypothetical protein